MWQSIGEDECSRHSQICIIHGHFIRHSQSTWTVSDLEINRSTPSQVQLHNEYGQVSRPLCPSRALFGTKEWAAQGSWKGNRRSGIILKVKLSHTRYQALGPELIPVYRQSADRWLLSHPPGGRLPLLSARPAVTFPAAEHHRPLAGTKLYCLVTEAHRCEQQGCYVAFAPSRIRTQDL